MANLSILHISTSDTLGGSAKSAYKIHLGLKRLGVSSRMLVRSKLTGDGDINILASGFFKLVDLIGRFGCDRVGLQFLFYPSSLALLRHPWFQEADVIQLYNIHGYYFSHTVLPLLGKEKKIVWRLSDMWPLTGHCAYSYDCERWQTGCGRCPRLDEYPPLVIDTSALLWRIKKKIYQRSNIQLVATNSWMAGLLRHSPLLDRFQKSIVPNGVDTSVFKPLSKTEARELLGIDKSSKVVLFLAHVAIPGTRKGGEFVIPAMEKCADVNTRKLILLVVGERAESWQEGRGYKTIRFGYTENERFLVSLYSAADVLLCPSVAENFPNTAIESFACATPAVGFDCGGMSDVVRPMETGYLARYQDGEDLARGLKMLLEDRSLRMKMGDRCREVAKREYSVELQAQRFKTLYEKVVLS